MDTVTYPDAIVTRFLSEHFVCFSINIAEKHPDYKEACGSSRVMFSPTFLFVDPKGGEIRRYNGWLPPISFLGELQFTRAMYEFSRGQFLAAENYFLSTINQSKEADVVPEAMYWHGVASFFAGDKDINALKNSWHSLRKRFPHSTWAKRASVVDDLD